MILIAIAACGALFFRWALFEPEVDVWVDSAQVNRSADEALDELTAWLAQRGLHETSDPEAHDVNGSAGRRCFAGRYRDDLPLHLCVWAVTGHPSQSGVELTFRLELNQPRAPVWSQSDHDRTTAALMQDLRDWCQAR